MNQNKQAAPAVVMRRPVNFGFNEETAGTNVFQNSATQDEAKAILDKAINEFDDFVKLLGGNGVEVFVYDDDPENAQPDAVFVNNWMSLHENGKVIFYPMLAENRRKERSEDLIQRLGSSGEYAVKSNVDFSAYESENLFLEGTGSVVLDYAHEKIYANYSSRTNSKLLAELSKELQYDLVDFDAKCPDGSEIYHTNVLMCIAEEYTIVCDECIHPPERRTEVLHQLENDGHEIISISYDQMSSFAGNMLEVSTSIGESVLVMSEQAHKSLDENQLRRISKYSTILHSPIYTIEKYGGGSARCMMAANFLPKKS